MIYEIRFCQSSCIFSSVIQAIIFAIVISLGCHREPGGRHVQRSRSSFAATLFFKNSGRFARLTLRDSGAYSSGVGNVLFGNQVSSLRELGARRAA